MNGLFLEDFASGQDFALGPHLVTREAIVDFAQEFDPQPFHLEEAASATSLLGKLSASGWHTASIVMRLMSDAFMSRSAVLGSSGMEEVRWLRPVHVDDVLSGSCAITGARPSASKPGIGIVNFHASLSGHDGLERISIKGMIFMRRRAA